MNKHIFKLYIFLMILSAAACSKQDASPSMDPSSVGGNGVGGSMARFTIAGDYLYTVDFSNMKVFDIKDISQPKLVNQLNVGANIETIFARDENTLFIGSENGMFIYTLENPESPRSMSVTPHIRSYDPVVANDKFAYVTLRSGPNRGVDQLQVFDITNLQRAQLLTTYEMVNPYGLGLRDSLLFVCDDGLKMYDATNPMELKLLQTYNIKAFDVIPLPNILLVIGGDGLYQYRQEGNKLTLLSKIPVSNI